MIVCNCMHSVGVIHMIPLIFALQNEPNDFRNKKKRQIEFGKARKARSRGNRLKSSTWAKKPNRQNRNRGSKSTKSDLSLRNDSKSTRNRLEIDSKSTTKNLRILLFELLSSSTLERKDSLSSSFTTSLLPWHPMASKWQPKVHKTWQDDFF